MSKKISVIGQGFVGLPITLLLAEKNFIVFGYDINHKLIDKLTTGTYGDRNENEDQVIKLYKQQYKKNNLSFSSSIVKSDIYVICVPTPIKKNKTSDLSYVNAAIKKITPLLEKDNTIIIESTISIGSIDLIQKKIKKNINKINLAYCPERVLPGNAINELVNNDRIIGGIDKKSSLIAKQFYQIFVKGKIHITSVGVAEFVKLAENAYRDVNIAYANELSVLCEKSKVDYNEVIRLSNQHPRVNILNPSIGVGGHCIPIDPWFLIENNKNNFSVIKNSRIVNKRKTLYVAKKIISLIKNAQKLSTIKNIFFMGLTYKPNISDLRESPAVEIIEMVSKKIKKNIFVNDPYISKNIFSHNKNIKSTSIITGTSKSQVIIILVAHNEYKDIHKFIRKHHYIYDGCNLLKNV